MAEYYLGIDGGATKTKFVIADEAGNILREAVLAASNPIDLGTEKCFCVLKEGIEQVVSDIPYKEVNVFAGISGGITGNSKSKIGEFLRGFGFKSFANGSDSENIIAAGLKDDDGIAVIMGTGSCAFVSKGETVERIGGLGYLFDFAGSGYDIGAHGIAAALRQEDGTGEETSIRGKILLRTGKSRVFDSLGEFYEKGKTEIASYAPTVFESFDENDEVAKQIISANMQHIAMLLHAAGKRFETKIVRAVFVGGLTKRFDILAPLIKIGLARFDDTHEYAFEVLKDDVTIGALYKAGLAYGDRHTC